MDLKLTGLKVLVTGASKGLGAVVVEAFLTEGAVVTMCSRSEKNMETAARAFSCKTDNLYCVPVDVRSEGSVKSCIEKASERMDGLDILVNNAGGATKFASFFDLERQDWMAHFEYNVMSMVDFCKMSHSYLKESRCPRIVNISSLTGLQPGIFNPHYSVSKAAVINLSKHLANLFVKDGIHVNCIVPGPFESHSWDRNIRRVANELNIDENRAREKEMNGAIQSIPVGRIGQPEDIVPYVLMLASPVSQWMTGSCIVIDGGKMRTI
jgi:3-oxoacyl-[acyl-carrier protein] reductase